MEALDPQNHRPMPGDQSGERRLVLPLREPLQQAPFAQARDRPTTEHPAKLLKNRSVISTHADGTPP